MKKYKSERELFRTSNVQDFKLGEINDIPEGYPKAVLKDSYTRDLTSNSSEERKDLFINERLILNLK